MSFILLGILNSQVTASAAGAYDLLQTTVLTSSASSVTFSSIPSDYKHLQIRAVIRGNDVNYGAAYLRIRTNGDTSSSYAFHSLYGDGSSVTSNGFSSQSYLMNFIYPEDGATANMFSPIVLDVLDYASTNKNTTFKMFAGGQVSGNERSALYSGLWNNTSAVNSLLFYPAGGSFKTGSRFSLYGIKG